MNSIQGTSTPETNPKQGLTPADLSEMERLKLSAATRILAGLAVARRSEIFSHAAEDEMVNHALRLGQRLAERALEQRQELYQQIDQLEAREAPGRSWNCPQCGAAALADHHDDEDDVWWRLCEPCNRWWVERAGSPGPGREGVDRFAVKEPLIEEPVELLHVQTDAPPCSGCGTVAIAAGAVWSCPNCNKSWTRKDEPVAPEEKPLAGLWRNNPETPEGKYLVQRRDGTVPEWPSFVLGAKDPAAAVALRAYADEAEQIGLYPEFVRQVRELAGEFDRYRIERGEGDPDRGRHREDDPATIAKMKHGRSA